MIDKNTVIPSLKDYLDLIKENEILRERLKEINEEVVSLYKDNHNLLMERKKWKKLMLEEAELLTIRIYDEFELERIIDSEDCAFGLRNPKRLLKLGFTMEELIDYIKERRELCKKEES